MLIRLVKMTFQPGRVADFLAFYPSVASRIRAFPGCTHLEFLQDVADPTTFATYSHWASAEALDAYRRSDLFRPTWAHIKPWFARSAEATSFTAVSGLQDTRPGRTETNREST